MASRISQRWSGNRCLALHGLLVGIMLIAYGLGSVQVTLILGGTLAAGCFFFFAWLETQKTFLKITPISTYFVWQGFALGPAAIYTGFQVLEGNSVYVGLHFVPPEFLEKGYIIGLIGTLSLHAGLQWLRPRDEAEGLPDFSAHELNSLLPALFVLYWVGIASLVFYKELVFLGMVTGFFQFSSHAALVGFILIPAKRLRMAEVVRTALIVVGSAILFLAATRAGSKMYLMLALIGMFFYVLQSKKLRKHVLAAAGVLIFLYLTVIAPTINESRKIQYRDRLSFSQAIFEAFTLYSPLYTGRFEKTFYLEQMDALFSRQFECSSIGAIAEEVELKGFINGETFYQIRYVFIPRILWPDKPLITRGAWFTSYLGSSARETSSASSTGMEAAGELYWNFGFPGVVLGMFVLGLMFGFIWRMSGANPAMRPLHLALYMLNTLTMMNIPEAATRMASCIAIIVFFGLVFKLMRPHRRTKMMTFQRVELPNSARS